MLDILYHYTTLSGLCGIFSTKSIWATSICHQTDPSEFDYALKLAKRIVRSYVPNSDSDSSVLSDIFNKLSKTRDEIMEHYKIFAASFSKHGDLKSQWQTYCPDGGFSIGFDFSQLRDDLGHHDRPNRPFPFAPLDCTYDKAKQIAEIRFILDGVLNYVLNNNHEFRDDPMELLYRCATKMKHTCFRDEQEIRFVSSRSIPIMNFKIRGTWREPIPYYEMLLAPQNGRIHVPKLIVSPSKDTESSYLIAKHLKEAFRDQVDIDNIEVSKISYDEIQGSDDAYY